ncbi:MAG: hypothetical protein KBA33_08215 [Cloacibacterium sp.]|nr:hypothetical protein [Cloacibacterium sp.]
MSKIFGIDLGTNSIGWAIRNTNVADNQIEDYGVITFEKGVASEKGNEFPKVQKRTESRGKRRNYQAEKYRKFHLLEFLIAKNMCPLSIEELNNWKKYRKGEKREYPQSEDFVNWLRFDFNGDGKPDFHLFGKDEHESYYVFRTLAVDERYKDIFTKNAHILGRVFYQLVQRRGFKGRDEAEAKTMLEGSDKNGTKGRNDIEKYLENYKTLGSALYHYQKENGGRIRQRYNLRKDYESELKEICEIHNISKDDYEKLWKSIIWQRPLRTQKGLIGNCIYEKGKKRVSVSHPLYEEYRTWIFINNLKIEPPFQEDLQEYLWSKIYPIFYKSTSDFELNVIDKQLAKDGAKRLSRHHEKTKVISAKILKFFQDIFGENWKEILQWNNIHDRNPQQEKRQEKFYTFEDIWHVLNTFDGQENLKNFALEKLNLDEEKANKFSKFKLQQGYATLSLSAIKKILPYLQKGHLYSHAVYMANLHKILGETQISETLIKHFSDDLSNILSNENEERTTFGIVNSLITAQLEDRDNRYQIEDDRALDSSEQRRVNEKILDAFGEKTWNSFTKEKQTEITNFVSEEFRKFLKKPITEKGIPYLQPNRIHDKIFKFLQDSCHVTDDKKKYLWHPSEQENYAEAVEHHEYSLNGKKYYIKPENIDRFLAKNDDAEYEGRSIKLLGNPEPLSKGFKNPMALKSLYKLKNLINYLLQTGKIDEQTRVVIEIARDLNDKNKRRAIELWQKEREKENEKFRQEFQEYKEQFPDKKFIDEKTLVKKIRLWNEQGKMCLYTGKQISFTDLVEGTKYDFEHTIPASISFDNELKNLTIADANYNRNTKGKRFPTQLINYNSEQIIDGKTLKPILANIENIFGKRKVKQEVNKKGNTKTIVTWEKVEDLEKQYDEWKKKSAYASTKDFKDYCIVKYHMIKMDLDYLKAKLKTFTIDEYPAGWRNSQLRDTQIITKYALPYLKTLFKKASVEKGEVVSKFKEIYNVKFAGEKKDRGTHAHHAQDAVVLTLIPNAFHRERILKKYQEQKDISFYNTYHEQPLDWQDFKPKYVLDVENNILINNLTDNRTITQTAKTVRRRGKIIYDVDKSGNSKKRISEGDTIRGQLHGESLYGAIKQPVRDEENKIKFDENQKMILHDKINVVIRKPLLFKKDANSPGFKTLEEIEKIIVDKDLFKIIKQQVEQSDFKTALTNGVYMLDRQGNKVGEKIRRIRCFENLKYENIIKVHEHSFKSDKDYKKTTLATNGENTYCLFYKNHEGKAMKILSIVDLAELKLKNTRSLYNEPEFSVFETGKGKNKKSIPLYAILKSGDKVIFYKNSIQELKDLEREDLSNRMFKVYQFESDGRMKFRHHLVAGIDTELKKINQEFSSVNFDEKQVFLRITQAHWNFAIEGKDFEMTLDGKINWKS